MFEYVKHDLKQGLIQQGIAQGKKEATIAIAKKMLAQNMSFNLIIKMTGLSPKEFEKLALPHIAKRASS